MQDIKENGMSSPRTLLQLSDMELSLKEVEELISLSKQMFKHIADSILSSDLIDSELVHAASCSSLEEGESNIVLMSMSSCSSMSVNQ